MSENGLTDRAAALAQFDEDAAYFAAHQQDLLRAHPDEWVAVYRKQVVGTAPGLDPLLAELRTRGIPTEQVFVQRLATREELLIV